MKTPESVHNGFVEALTPETALGSEPFRFRLCHRVMLCVCEGVYVMAGPGGGAIFGGNSLGFWGVLH